MSAVAFFAIVLTSVIYVESQDPHFSVYCPALPCPLPPPTCHRVQTYYWNTLPNGDKILCEGCIGCSNTDQATQGQVTYDNLKNCTDLACTSEDVVWLQCPYVWLVQLPRYDVSGTNVPCLECPKCPIS